MVPMNNDEEYFIEDKDDIPSADDEDLEDDDDLDEI